MTALTGVLHRLFFPATMARMKRSIVAKQPNSKMCFVCGLSNALGLKTAFYELDGGELLAIFEPADGHQSYPGRLHGGVSAAVLDETIGRAILAKSKGEVWGVTVEFSMRLSKPVPISGPLRVIGRIDKDSTRFFEGSGEILLPDGEIAVSAKGRYIKMPLDKIADFNREEQDWRVVPLPADPTDVEV
jgi:acyl-coenzyme A thioesterase PaaI-like protein